MGADLVAMGMGVGRVPRGEFRLFLGFMGSAAGGCGFCRVVLAVVKNTLPVLARACSLAGGPCNGRFRFGFPRGHNEKVGTGSYKTTAGDNFPTPAGMAEYDRGRVQCPIEKSRSAGTGHELNAARVDCPPRTTPESNVPSSMKRRTGRANRP